MNFLRCTACDSPTIDVPVPRRPGDTSRQIGDDGRPTGKPAEPWHLGAIRTTCLWCGKMLGYRPVKPEAAPLPTAHPEPSPVAQRRTKRSPTTTELPGLQ